VAAGRALWAGLHLLDRQVVDRDEVPSAKVDDLDFALADEPGGLPVLTDILCGQAALAGRVWPRLARGLELLRRTVDPVAEPGPARVPWSAVASVATHLTLHVRRQDLPVSVAERWLAREVVGRIPGAAGEEGDG
jgi:hypothetical protein